MLYYKKKAVRILPLYYFVIIYYMITETLFFNNDIPVDSLNLEWNRYIFLLNGIFPSDNYFWSNLGITWTIPVFVFFYLISPIIYRLVKSTKHAVICFVTCLLIRMTVAHYMNGYFSMLTYMVFFLLGIIAYFVKKEHKEIAAIAILVVITIAELGVQGKLEWAYVFLFTVLIIISDQFKIQNKVLNWIIDTVDNYSYTLYLIHGVIFCGLIDEFQFPIIVRLFIAIFGTLFFTVLVYQYFELPVQRKLKKFLLND